MDWLVDKQATTHWQKHRPGVENKETAPNIKRTGEVEERRSEAVHWHLSTNFHLLCHDLTNCSTHCKHGSQPLHSKWGLHTPFQFLWPMWNLSLKFLFIVALPHSLNLRFPPRSKDHTGTKAEALVSLSSLTTSHISDGEHLLHWGQRNALNQVTAWASLCHVKRPGIKASGVTHPCGLTKACAIRMGL